MTDGMLTPMKGWRPAYCVPYRPVYPLHAPALCMPLHSRKRRRSRSAEVSSEGLRWWVTLVTDFFAGESAASDAEGLACFCLASTTCMGCINAMAMPSMAVPRNAAWQKLLEPEVAVA